MNFIIHSYAARFDQCGCLAYSITKMESANKPLQSYLTNDKTTKKNSPYEADTNQFYNSSMIRPVSILARL